MNNGLDPIKELEGEPQQVVCLSEWTIRNTRYFNDKRLSKSWLAKRNDMLHEAFKLLLFIFKNLQTTSSCPLTHIRMSIKNTEIHFQTYHDFEIKTFWILGYFSLENPFGNDLWIDAKTCQRLSSSPCSKALERVFPERHSNFLGRVIIIFFCSTELWHDSLLRIMMSLNTLW